MACSATDSHVFLAYYNPSRDRQNADHSELQKCLASHERVRNSAGRTDDSCCRREDKYMELN
jgi:hypothetical protein